MGSNFSESLRELMDERGVSGSALARRVPCDRGLISRFINGKQDPSRRMARRLDEVLAADGRLVDFVPATRSDESRKTRSRYSSIEPGVVSASRVIEALGVLESDHNGDIADSLAALVDHYSQTICSVPPADIYDELLEIRSYVSTAVDRAKRGVRWADLLLSAGWLSNLLAVASCDMGEHAAARVWCSDAERRSQELRCPELAAWAVLTRAMIAYYRGQSRTSILLSAQGQNIAPIGTVIHAKLAALEMRAAAMAGDSARMTCARRHAAKAMENLSGSAKSTGVFSITAGQDPPYTATSLFLIGHFSEAVSATNRVLQAVYQSQERQPVENPSGYARCLLILGLAQAGAGNLDEATAAGHAALACNRPAWPTMVLAGKLDQALALDYPGSRHAVAYRASYLEAASWQAGVRRQKDAKSGGNL